METIPGSLPRAGSLESLASYDSSGNLLEVVARDTRVLIVDDELINTKIVSSALTKQGFQCVSLSDGSEVVDLCCTKGERFDVILMDSMMKIMDGPDAVAAVRQHEWNTQQLHQPIVAVTASILGPDQELCMRMGYQGMISKPIAAKGIASQIDNFLQIWNMSEESKILRSPAQWRSDPFSSLFRNNMAWFDRPMVKAEYGMMIEKQEQVASIEGASLDD